MHTGEPGCEVRGQKINQKIQKRKEKGLRPVLREKKSEPKGGVTNENL